MARNSALQPSNFTRLISQYMGSEWVNLLLLPFPATCLGISCTAHSHDTSEICQKLFFLLFITVISLMDPWVVI